MKKKLVLKLGSHVLTAGGKSLSGFKIIDVANQLIEIKKEYEVIIVSSGAIAAAKDYLKKNNFNSNISKQALSAIGQPILMKTYKDVFYHYKFGVAQCLLTYYDFDNKKSRENSLRLFKNLWKENHIPVINENDAIATDEIKFGDNDKLAALTASLINADLLVLASDINGLYTDDPKTNSNAKLIENVNNIAEYDQYIKDSKSSLGTGGMTSKFLAAEICMKKNIEMWVVNGLEDNFLSNALNGKTKFTSFKNLNPTNNATFSER